jgi:hypothetical protein
MQGGLVRRTVYRPANATVIRHRLELMSPEERALVRHLSRGETTTTDPLYAGLTRAAQARVLEVSYDYLAYLRAIGTPPVEQPEELARTLVLERSRIGASTDAPHVPVPGVRPDQGPEHLVSRSAAAATARTS